MWGYYGSKSKIVQKYPEPKHTTVIEPFAGTAQYALRYWENDIFIYDKYDVIINLWKWLQTCSKSDILNIRQLKYGESTDNFTWNCEEEKNLVGFIITGAPSTPKKTASRWKTVVRPNTQNYKLNYIADNLYKIKHWSIEVKSFDEVENRAATWFIDPPYQNKGKYYKYGSKNIDYDVLSLWCQERVGQTIVCEDTSATWLPFKPLTTSRGNRYQHSEAIWLSD